VLFVTPICHTVPKTKHNTTEQITTPRKTTKKTTRLKRSKLENLFRHANGVYWVRAKVNGKSVERSLRTEDYNLAATMGSPQQSAVLVTAPAAAWPHF
jgi:hypothetical protein